MHDNKDNCGPGNDKNVTSDGSLPLLLMEVPNTHGEPCQVPVRYKVRACLQSNALLLLTMTGVCVGFGVGFGLRATDPPTSTIMWTGIVGEVYMRSLKVTILPLIVSSVIAGTASMDPKSNGKVSAIATAYVITTNLMGVVMGVLLFYVSEPGKDALSDETVAKEDTATRLQTQDMFADMIRNLMPDNIITASFQKTQTVYRARVEIELINGTETTVTSYVRTTDVAGGTNILGLIIICTVVGMATSKAGEAGQAFLNFFKATSEVIITVLRWLIWFTPLGVASIIASALAKVDDIGTTFRSVGIFVVAVIVGLCLLTVVLIPLAYFLVVRKNPIRFLYTALRPFMTAFATTSSAVTIPEVLHMCEVRHGVNTNISRFFVPFASALNRTGSCIYITMATLLLSRLESVDLEGAKLLYLILLCTVSSMAIPAVPSGSIICTIVILSAVGVTTTNVGLLITLEWLIDRLRTVANVGSISFGAIFLHACCRARLRDPADADHKLSDGRQRYDQET